MAYKASITIKGEVYTGQRLDSIARREYGYGAQVQFASDTNNTWQEDNVTGQWLAGQITIVKEGRHGTVVLAEGVGRVKL